MNSALPITMDQFLNDPVACAVLTQYRRGSGRGEKRLTVSIDGDCWDGLDTWCTEQRVTKTSLLEAFLTAFLASRALGKDEGGAEGPGPVHREG